MQHLARTAVLTVLTAALGAQADAQTMMTVRPESKVTLDGSSNVHDWSCKSSAFQATIQLDSSYQTRPMTELAKPITKVVVNVPVKSLKCGKAKMDENMYKALRADEFTDIRYVLDTYELTTELTGVNTFAARTFGELTVAGRTNRVEIPLTALRTDGGSMKGEGTLKILMTDFGIKPPVALLGTLRTKNEIEVTFQVLLDKAVVVALMQQQ
jgi:polyisoprenoid-binding protein YceI